jgi:hypothetical protein
MSKNTTPANDRDHNRSRSRPPENYVPLSWHAFYELGRQIWVGCVVTFGPYPVRQLRQESKMKNAALQIRFVLNSEGEETEPVTRELPRTALDYQALAARITGAIAQGMTTRIADSPEKAILSWNGARQRGLPETAGLSRKEP